LPTEVDVLPAIRRPCTRTPKRRDQGRLRPCPRLAYGSSTPKPDAL